MIGQLPKTLIVDDVEYDINSDFRASFDVFEAFNDTSLSPFNKQLTMLEIIFTPIGEEEPIIPPNLTEAAKQAVWFLNIGQENPSHTGKVKTMDYVQDEQLLFSAINSVMSTEVREFDYWHWWSFYAACQAISSDSLIAHIANIRHKKGKGKKLEKHEQQFYKENRHLIDFRTSGDAYEAMVRELRRG